MAAIIDRARCLTDCDIGEQQQERKIDVRFEKAESGNEAGEEGRPGQISVVDSQTRQILHKIPTERTEAINIDHINYYWI